MNADQIINDLRPKLRKLVGVQVSLQAAQDINVGGRAGRAQYQYTLSDADIDELNDLGAKAVGGPCRRLPQLKDVSSDQQSQASAVNADHRPRRRRPVRHQCPPISTPPSTT